MNIKRMTKNKKILIIGIIILLLLFLFPKKSGTWMVSKDADFYCKCLGYEHITGSPLKSGQPGNSLCFGIPYSCGNAGLDYYFGQ